MADPVLVIRKLYAYYGKVEALSDINLSVGEGQIVTVIGPMVRAKPLYFPPRLAYSPPKVKSNLMACSKLSLKLSIWSGVA